MRKVYVTILFIFSLVVSSYITDNTFSIDITDTPKVIHFYPNPAVSFINFVFDKSVDRSYTLQIYSFIGRKMTEVRITDTKITVNFDDTYYRGLYVYQLRDQGGRIVESGKFQVIK